MISLPLKVTATQFFGANPNRINKYLSWSTALRRSLVSSSSGAANQSHISVQIMKVTFASVLLLVAVVATSMTSVEGRKISRRHRGYNEDDVLLEQYANAGLDRDLKGKKKVEPFEPKSCKSAKSAGDPTCAPSAGPSMAPSLSSAPSSEPSKSPSSNPSAEPSLAPSSDPSESPSDAPSSEPSPSPSSAPSVSNAPTKGKGTPKSSKNAKRARRLYDRRL